MGVMRSSLLGSLLQVLRYNRSHRVERLRVFEIGRVFLRDAAAPGSDASVQGIRQPMRVAGLAWGDVNGSQWGQRARTVDFYDVKGDIERLLSRPEAQFRPATHPAMHPGRCAEVWLAGVNVGVIGELHPKWRQLDDLATPPVLFELDLEAVIARSVPRYQGFSKYPTSERDLALIVDSGVSYASIKDVIAATDSGGLLRQVHLFDLYKSTQTSVGMAEHEKSVAVRLVLGNNQSSLTDEQINAAVGNVVSELARRFGARLRA